MTTSSSSIDLADSPKCPPLSGDARLLLCRVLLGGLLVSMADQSSAAVLVKSDSNSLQLPADWTGGLVPGVYDVASFTTAVSATNLANLALGSNASWQGLSLGPSNGPMVIKAGNTLTLGTSGINLATATNGLTINSGLALQGAQSWSAAAGRTLTIGGTFTHTGARVDFTNFSTSATLAGITNDASGILGAWATTGVGSTLNYVKNTGGVVGPYTGQTATGTTAQTNNYQNVVNPNGNYEAGGASASPQSNLTGNTLRYSSNFGGGAAFGGFTLTLNGLMNTGTGRVSFFANGGGGLVVGATNELVILTSQTTDPTGYNFASVEIAAPIADGLGGAGRVTKSGPGVLRLTGTNTFTGPLTVASGTVILSSSTTMGSTVGDTTPVHIAAGATLAVQTVEAFGALTGLGTLETAALTRPNSDGSSSIFGGIISNPNGTPEATPTIIKDGIGTLTLTNQSTYTQSTFVDGGTLRLGTNNVLNPGNNVRFRLNGPTAALDLNGFAQTLGTISFGPLGITSGGDAGGSGSGSIIGSGPGSVLTVNQIRYEGNSHPLFGATISVNTLDLGGAVRNFIVNDSTSAAVDLAVSSTIRNGGLIVGGEGQYTESVTTLSGTNTYTGPTTVSSGTLKAGASTTVFGLGGAVTVNGVPRAALLDLDGFNVTIGSLTLGAPTNSTANSVQTGVGTLTLGGDLSSVSLSAQSATIAGNLALGSTRTFTVADSTGTTEDLIVSARIAGPGAGLIKAGPGTLVLTGSNVYDGPTSIGDLSTTSGAGRVLVRGAAGSIKTSEATVTGAGSQLRLDYTDVADGAVDRYGDTKAVTLNLGGELYLRGNLAADSSETLGTLRLNQGAGIISLDVVSNNNRVTLSAGQFDRGANRGTALIRGESLGRAIQPVARVQVVSQAGLNLVGTSTTAGATDLKISPFLFGAATLAGTGNSFLTYGADGLRPLATTEQTLLANGATGDNVRSTPGTTSITGPRVYNSLLLGLDSGGSASSQGAIVMGDGSTLAITSGATAAVNFAGKSLLSGFGSIVFGTTGANEAIVTVSAANAFLTLGSPINTAAPGGGLTKAGAGRLFLAASNLYTGATVINQGTLIIGSEATGDLGSNTAPIIVQRDANLSFGRTDAGLTLVNVISGQGSVSQTSGTVTLSAANTYTGSTTIGDGALVVSGSISGSTTTVNNLGVLQLGAGGLAGPVTVNSGGSLRGLGTAGPTSIVAGGTLAPGVGIGTLGTGPLTLSDTSNLALELGNSSADRVNIAGAVTLEGSINLTLALTSVSPDTQVFTILHGTAPLVGYSTGARFLYGDNSLMEGEVFTVSSNGFTRDVAISYAGNAGRDVTLTVIPEPRTTAVLLWGGVCLLSRRRSRGATKSALKN